MGIEGAQGITIAEAARRLNVSERTLRRALGRPEYTGRTLAKYQQTRTGTRETCLLPADVVSDLAAHFLSWETPADTGNEYAAQHPKNTGNAGTEESENAGARPASMALVVTTYERLITEQQARIVDLQTALEHEREQSRRLADALQREQTLRVLQVPPIETEMPPGSAQSDENTELVHQPPEAAAQPQTAADTGERRQWWEFWKR